MKYHCLYADLFGSVEKKKESNKVTHKNTIIYGQDKWISDKTKHRRHQVNQNRSKQCKSEQSSYKQIGFTEGWKTNYNTITWIAWSSTDCKTCLSIASNVGFCWDPAGAGIGAASLSDFGWRWKDEGADWPPCPTDLFSTWYRNNLVLNLQRIQITEELNNIILLHFSIWPHGTTKIFHTPVRTKVMLQNINIKKAEKFLTVCF